MGAAHAARPARITSIPSSFTFQLGVDLGQTIGVCESAEATRPFEKPTPIDAYCAALIDTIFHQAEDPHGK